MNRKKNSTQQEKPASSSSKMAQKATTAVQTFWKVKSGEGGFFTQQQEQGGPYAEGQNPDKSRARGVPKGGEGEARGNSEGYRQILSQLVEVKGLQLEGKGGREGFDGRRPKSSISSKNSGSSKPQQEHKQQNQQHKQHKQQPRNSEGQEVWVPNVGGGVFPWNFVRLCSRLFLYTNKICNDWSLNFFGSLRGEANQL